MVNSGISKVGVVTKSNFQSLMDHLGSGKAWIYLVNAMAFSSFSFWKQDQDIANSRIEALESIRHFGNIKRRLCSAQ